MQFPNQICYLWQLHVSEIAFAEVSIQTSAYQHKNIFDPEEIDFCKNLNKSREKNVNFENFKQTELSAERMWLKLLAKDMAKIVKIFGYKIIKNSTKTFIVKLSAIPFACFFQI